MKLQKLLDQAWKLKKEGELVKSLSLYNKVFDILIKEASEYARSFENTHIDKGKTRKILPAHFSKSKEYLKKDRVASVTSNNMGTIFAELNDFKSAKKFFHQAIALTPNSENYEDPHIALKELRK